MTRKTGLVLLSLAGLLVLTAAIVSRQGVKTALIALSFGWAGPYGLSHFLDGFLDGKVETGLSIEGRVSREERPRLHDFSVFLWLIVGLGTYLALAAVLLS